MGCFGGGEVVSAMFCGILLHCFHPTLLDMDWIWGGFVSAMVCGILQYCFQASNPMSIRLPQNGLFVICGLGVFRVVSISLPQERKDNGLNARWRRDDARLDHAGLLQHLQYLGRSLSPIWSYPLVKAPCLKLDWLHLADLGVSASFMGGICCILVEPPGHPDFGGTIAGRTLTLWHLMDHWYKEHKVYTDRLKSLPVTRFRLKPACLKAQGATIRRLVPFFVELVGRLDLHDEEQKSAITGMMALSECYRCLSKDADVAEDHLKKQASMSCGSTP